MVEPVLWGEQIELYKNISIRCPYLYQADQIFVDKYLIEIIC